MGFPRMKANKRGSLGAYRAGIRQPRVEVRFEGLHVETEVFSDAARNLPSVIGMYRDLAEVPPPPLITTDLQCIEITASHKYPWVCSKPYHPIFPHAGKCGIPSTCCIVPTH